MGMDVYYDWRFNEPGESLNVHMINRNETETIFDATLTLQRKEITPRSLRRVLLRYPMMTLQVTSRIYRQAMRLRMKGAPFFVHPKKRNLKGRDRET
jgi:DUF1365 family protein